MSNGATITFNDPRRFGFMNLVARDKLEEEPLLRALGPEPLGNEFDAALLAQACRGKKTPLKAALLTSASSPGSAISMSARRCTARGCRRSAALDDRDTQRRAQDHARAAGRGHPAVLNDAIKAGGSSLRDHRQTDGALGMFQHNFRVYDREGERCATPGARARSGASCSPAARPSFVRCARNNGRTRSHAATASRASRPTGRPAISPSALEAAHTRLG